MTKLVTEMLKGTLEGIVLAILSGRAAYGYEITAWLREQGFSDIAEGTVYALLIRVEQRGLVDVEKVPSERGRRARCTPSTPTDANISKSSGGPGASSQNGWNSSAKEATEMATKWIELVTGSLEQKKQYRQYKARIEALPEPYGTVAKALQRYFMYYGGVTDGETAVKMFGDFADLWERAAADGTPVRAIVGDDPVEFAEHSRRPTPERDGSTRNAPD